MYEWRYEQEIKSNGGKLDRQGVTKFVDRFMPAYELYLKPLLKNGLFVREIDRELFVELDRARCVKGYRTKIER